jgi:Calcineurin-like phosphoesterase
VRKLALCLLPVLACACGSSDEETPKSNSDAGACAPGGVSKRPWVLHVDETGALVRWEACSESSPAELAFSSEAGGSDTTVASTVTVTEIPNTYTAAFLPDLPPDSAGTYYMHEAALTSLSAGTCYKYQLAADASMSGRFCTARPSGASFKILAVGDTNPGLGDNAEKLLEKVAPENYDLTLHEGDIQYYASGLETWATWFPAMAPMLAQGAFYPAVGNHELEKPDEFELYYLRFFGNAGFDGDAGHFRAQSGGVWFFALNTELPLGPGSEQAVWFETELKDAATKPGYRFSIVFVHRPFLTCGDTSQDDGDRAGLQPLFEQYQVPLVLQGHMHGYERFEVPTAADPQKTVTYLTVAGGGGALGDIDKNIDRPTCSMRIEKGAYYHMEVLEIAPGTLKGRTIDVDGSVRDTFEKSVP